MLEYLRRNKGLVRLTIYLITIILLFFRPIATSFMFLKLLAVVSLLLLMGYFYMKMKFYNINYRIPDLLCILCLVNQFSHIVWSYISR